MAKRIFPKTFQAQVTEDDIKLGNGGNPKSCAIARGAKRVLKTSKSVEVWGDGVIKIQDGKNFFGYTKYISYKPTESKIKKFINDFDNGKKVKPTTFTFKLVESYYDN